MAQSLSFIRVQSLPTTGLVTGRVYFVEDLHALYVATSATEATCYSGLLNAVLADNILTITKADKTTCVVNLQDVASAAKMEEELAKKLNIGTADDVAGTVSYYGLKKDIAAAQTAAVEAANGYTDGQITAVNGTITTLEGKVTTNTTNITNLTTTVGENATTAKNYTDEQVGLAKTYAEEKAAAAQTAAEGHADSVAATAKSEAIAAAAEDATTKAGTAKAEAIAAAAEDATTKANAAEANAKQFATEQIAAQIATAFTYEGSVDTYEELPSENLAKGMVYNVVAAHGTVPAGTNYVWNGTEWDALAGVVDLTPFAKTADVAATYETIANVNAYKETAASTYETIANVNAYKETVAATYETIANVNAYKETVAGTYATIASLGETNTKVGQLETAIGTINTNLADYAKTADVNSAISTAKGELQAEIDKKATIETVNGIDGRLQTAEGTITTQGQTIASQGEAIAAIQGSYVKSITSGTSGQYVTVTANSKATGDVNVMIDTTALDTEISTMKNSITAAMSWVEF